MIEEKIEALADKCRKNKIGIQKASEAFENSSILQIIQQHENSSS